MSARRQQIKNVLQGLLVGLLPLDQPRADDRIDLFVLPALEVGRGQPPSFDPHVVPAAEPLLQDGGAKRLVIHQQQALAADQQAAQCADARSCFQDARAQVGCDLPGQPAVIPRRAGQSREAIEIGVLGKPRIEKPRGRSPPGPGARRGDGSSCRRDSCGCCS